MGVSNRSVIRVDNMRTYMRSLLFLHALFFGCIGIVGGCLVIASLVPILLVF